VVIVAATLLALWLRVYYQYVRPGFLLGVNEYDDGPYFGGAVRLVHGALPYRDFIFVQPPGITLLMSPVGLLADWTGTAWGLAIGRLLTVAAGTASVVLGGLLVRHRGLLAVLCTCGILAIYPDAVAAAHTVLVEPWLVLFCLAGAVAVFDGDAVAASTKRLVLGGVAFGFAGAVEAWAIVPVIMVLALCLPHLRRAARFAAGVAAGFLVPVLPFVAAGPSQFYRSLIVAQIGYRAHAYRIGAWFRLRNMTGIPGAQSWAHSTVLAVALAIVAFVAAAQATGWLATRRPPPALDWFATLSAALVVIMFLWPPQFHYHFSAFLAPFLGLSIALAATRLVAGAERLAGGLSAKRWLWPAAAGLAAVAVVVAAVFQGTSERPDRPVIGPIPPALVSKIPAGACVLTDQVSLTIAANRFVSDVPGCPLMVDTLGTDLALSDGLKPATGAARVPAVTAVWREAFGRAQYVLLTRINARRIPWSPALTAYFDGNFAQIFQSQNRLTLYVRKGLTHLSTPGALRVPKARQAGAERPFWPEK